MSERTPSSSHAAPSHYQGSGCDITAACLRDLGVNTAFGLPGTQNVDLLESFARCGLRFVPATNECHAGFMALGYARASEQTAVLTTIPGPGFTYALTALAEARADSIPLLYLLVGPERPGYRNALHALPHEALLREVIKEYHQVNHAASVPQIIATAFRATTRGEPGPVAVEISYLALRDYCASATASPESDNQQSNLINLQQWGEIAARIKQAKRPLLFLGGGARPATNQLRKFVQRWPLPVISTVSGRGIISDDDPTALPIDFAFGASEQVVELFRQSDLVLAIGAKLTHNGTAGFSLPLEESNLILIDSGVPPDSAQLGQPHEYSWNSADACQLLLDAELGFSPWPLAELSALRERFAAERTREIPYPPSLPGIRETAVEFFSELRNATSDSTVVVTDAGLHQSLTRRYLPVRLPGTLLAPIDFQAMGFGIPAAIGAAFASSRSTAQADGQPPVVALVGDGSFLSTGLELSTAVREGLPLVVIVWNDGHYGSIFREQVRKHGSGRGTVLPQVNLEQFAHSIGARYERLETPLGESLRRALLHRQQVVIAELLVEEHPGLAVAAATSRMRATVRRTLGRRLTGSLKRLAKR